MRTTAGNPRRCRTPRADPGHPREPGADGTVLSWFFQLRPPLTRGASAHLTTRTLRSADATPADTSHLTLADATPAVTGTGD